MLLSKRVRICKAFLLQKELELSEEFKSNRFLRGNLYFQNLLLDSLVAAQQDMQVSSIITPEFRICFERLDELKAAEQELVARYVDMVVFCLAPDLTCSMRHKMLYAKMILANLILSCLGDTKEVNALCEELEDFFIRMAQKRRARDTYHMGSTYFDRFVRGLLDYEENPSGLADVTTYLLHLTAKKKREADLLRLLDTGRLPLYSET